MNASSFIGNTKMPILGLGTWQLFGTQCVNTVKMALEIGYRHIDTASMYRNQKEIGKALKNTSVDRNDIFLTSKIWSSDLGKNGSRKSLDRALLELKTDYLDLYLIHWPGNDLKKRLESYEFMMLERDKGRLKHIGVSNFSVSQIIEIQKEFGEWPAVNQIHITPFNFDEDEFLFLSERNITVTAYSPLSKGRILDHPVLSVLSEKYMKMPAQIVIRWIIDRGIAAIPKAARPEHLKTNHEIFDFQLSTSDSESLNHLQ